MVDEMLTGLMDELGVTQEQFMGACSKAAENSIHQKIVDQITAVENFMAFKKLMVKRNTELNEQAMEMLKGGSQKTQEPKNSTSVPQHTSSGTAKATPALISRVPPQQQPSEEERAADEAMIKKALEISMQIENQKKAEQDEEDEMIKRVMEMSEREEKERVVRIKEEEDKVKSDEIRSLKMHIEEQNAVIVQQQQQQQQHHNQAPVQSCPQDKIYEKPHTEIQKQDHVQEKIAENQPQKQVGRVPKNYKQKPQVYDAIPLLPDKGIISKKPTFDLAPINMRRGGAGFDFDTDLLIEQHKNIAKINALKEFDDMEAEINNKKLPEEESGKSLKDLMKEKRKKTEKIIETTSKPAESVEDRRQRLKAQRDLLVKQKEDKREKDLEQFNQVTTTKDDLHRQLLEMDKNIKKKEKPKGLGFQEVIDDEQELSHDSPEVDKRLLMYKKMRNDLMKEESKVKEDNQNNKMNELDKKIENLEKVKMEKLLKMQEKEDLEKNKQKQRQEGNKNFLGNIKSFSVDDI